LKNSTACVIAGMGCQNNDSKSLFCEPRGALP
jgi:hypothetical protein